jgi:hypothetical protein
VLCAAQTAQTAQFGTSALGVVRKIVRVGLVEGT